MQRTILLSKLVPSPRNVRRVVDEAADAQLQADIAARGLLQNLVVTALDRPKGGFAVEAGGRRLKALKALQAEGALRKNHEVACLVLDDAEDASEASLAENFQRLAMNPADECAAFQAVMAGGTDAAGVARRFGLTVRFVEGRLRLANLAPVVFAALGAGEITLDLAKAFAASSDQERQAQVYEQTSRYGYTTPDSVRRMMAHETVTGSDPRAIYVGEPDYVAAGGRIERDLFADDEQARWLDVAVLERLAGEKLAIEAERLRTEMGLGFVTPLLERWVGYEDRAALRQLRIEPEPLTETEQAELDMLEASLEEHVDLLDDEDAEDAAREAAMAAIRAINGKIEALTERLPAIDPEIAPQVGMFLLLPADGVPRLDGAVFTAIEGGLARDEGADGPAGPAGSGGAGTSASPAPAGPKPGKLAQRLVDELAIQRRDVLASCIVADPGFARELTVFLIVDRGSGYGWQSAGSTLSARRAGDPVSGFATPEALATVALDRAAARLDRSWCELEATAERFDAFRALPETARDAWLAWTVAGTLEASGNGARACGFHDHIAGLLGVHVEDWWRPTAANWFDRVPKASSLAALAEVGGEVLAARHAKAKKGELAAACETIFAGATIVEAGVKAAALAWVPGPMRFAAAEPAPPWETGEGGATAEPDDEASPFASNEEDAVVVAAEAESEDEAAAQVQAEIEAETRVEADAGARTVGEIRPDTGDASRDGELAVTFTPDDAELGEVDFVFGYDDPVAEATVASEPELAVTPEPVPVDKAA